MSSMFFYSILVVRIDKVNVTINNYISRSELNIQYNEQNFQTFKVQLSIKINQ